LIRHRKTRQQGAPEFGADSRAYCMEVQDSNPQPQQQRKCKA